MQYSEPQLSSELLDQPLFSGTPLKVFICSTARSGSYMLCRYMVNAGLGVRHEPHQRTAATLDDGCLLDLD